MFIWIFSFFTETQKTYSRNWCMYYKEKRVRFLFPFIYHLTSLTWKYGWCFSPYFSYSAYSVCYMWNVHQLFGFWTYIEWVKENEMVICFFLWFYVIHFQKFSVKQQKFLTQTSCVSGIQGKLPVSHDQPPTVAMQMSPGSVIIVEAFRVLSSLGGVSLTLCSLLKVTLNLWNFPFFHACRRLSWSSNLCLESSLSVFFIHRMILCWYSWQLEWKNTQKNSLRYKI